MGFRKVILAMICVTSVSVLSAQEPGKQHISIGWGGAVTLGGNKVINKPTFIAPSFEYSYFLSDNFSLGFSLGFAFNNEADQQAEDRIKEGDGDYSLVTGKSSRKLSLIPIQVQGRYFPMGVQNIRFAPFVTLSAGFQYGSFNITGDNIQKYKGQSAGFVVTPDLGVRWFLNDRGKSNIDLRLSYQFGTNKWERYNENKSQQRVGVHLAFGMAF